MKDFFLGIATAFLLLWWAPDFAALLLIVGGIVCGVLVVVSLVIFSRANDGFQVPSVDEELRNRQS
ncbi:MAG: hypothetical protein HY609_06805 [Deltaproteobacteria bacterium]|nr:hypothetical protein [Candidatus Doudnabacteria bacterium]MBI4224629.1 hypothetical protein [Deltaproteobacteria bacterium]